LKRTGVDFFPPHDHLPGSVRCRTWGKTVRNKPSRRLRALVIAAADKLDEAEPVAEGIRQEGELTPLMVSDGLL